ncbi:hypothetical protein ACFL5O_01185 [Myxococcota bacterium]
MSSLAVLRKLNSASARAKNGLFSHPGFGFNPSTVRRDPGYNGPGCKTGYRASPLGASLVVGRYQPRTVFDFGCDRAALLREVARLAVPCGDGEGSPHGVSRCPQEALAFFKHGAAQSSSRRSALQRVDALPWLNNTIVLERADRAV